MEPSRKDLFASRVEVGISVARVHNSTEITGDLCESSSIHYILYVRQHLPCLQSSIPFAFVYIQTGKKNTLDTYYEYM